MLTSNGTLTLCSHHLAAADKSECHLEQHRHILRIVAEACEHRLLDMISWPFGSCSVLTYALLNEQGYAAASRPGYTEQHRLIQQIMADSSSASV